MTILKLNPCMCSVDKVVHTCKLSILRWKQEDQNKASSVAHQVQGQPGR